MIIVSCFLKVHMEVVTWISKAKCTACVIGRHNSPKSKTVRFIAKFSFSIYLYRVFRATRFLELALFLYCWLVLVVYILRQSAWSNEPLKPTLILLKLYPFWKPNWAGRFRSFCSVTNYIINLETFRSWPKNLILS